MAPARARVDARDPPERRLEALSDSELLAKYLAAASREDGSVWIQELFRRHYPKVISWCPRFAGGREEAYDLAQGRPGKGVPPPAFVPRRFEDLDVAVCDHEE
jgi:hypothetical protein